MYCTHLDITVYHGFSYDTHFLEFISGRPWGICAFIGIDESSRKCKRPGSWTNFLNFPHMVCPNFYQHHICSISSFAPMMLAKMGVVLRSTRTFSGIFRATHVMTHPQTIRRQVDKLWCLAQIFCCEPWMKPYSIPSHRNSVGNHLQTDYGNVTSLYTPLPIEDRTMQDIYTAYKYIHSVL